MKNKRLVFFLASSLLGKGFALPQGAEVSHGQAEFLHTDTQNLVIHASDKAIINYKEFNIGERESVEFIQPSSSASVLNRISGGNPSEILGALKSNGKIVLVNPSGVYFGPNATVSTGSLIASVLDIKDQDFLNDRYEFTLTPQGKNSTITNRGILSSPEGIIALLAPRILNEGMIATQVGKVFLGGAEKVTLDFHGDGMISFVLEGEIEDALIHNQGTIDAAGGTVMLRMKAANRAIQEVINTDDIAVATRMIEENGVITLVDESYICAKDVSIDGNNCTLHASGKIDASGEKGGTIALLADQIYLKGVEIDASGDFGGGTVLIGGDYQGSGDLHQAKWTYMDNSSTIWADAKTEGNGGKVIVWSNDTAIFDGTIFARGGAFSGNGGLVETSGKNQLGTRTGHVNTLAPHGKVGNWLLDPLTINVVTGGGGTLAQAADCTDVATNLSIDPATINAAASIVTLCASTSITVTDAISMTNPNVGLVFTANNGGAVPTTLNANITTRGGPISFSGNVTVLGASITLDTTNAAAQGSDVSIAGTINGTVGGTQSLTINCGAEGSASISNAIGATVSLANLTITANGGIILQNIGGGSPGATNVTFTSNAGTFGLSSSTINVSSFQCNGAFRAGTNLTLTSTNDIAVTGALEANGLNLSMTSSAGSITLGGAIGSQNSLSNLSLNAATTIAIDTVGSFSAVGANSLSLTAPTSITLNGGLYYTQLGQTYTGPVILNSPGHVSMRSNNVVGITFSSTVNASVANGAGLTAETNVTFNGAVGNTAALGFLNCLITTINASPIVTTNGVQEFASITIAQNTTFTNSGFLAGLINTTVAGSTLTITSGNGPVFIGGAIGSTATAMGAVNISCIGGIKLTGVGTTTPITGALTLSSNAGIVLQSGPYQALSHSYTGNLRIDSASATINSTNNVVITGTVDALNTTIPLTVTSTAGSINIVGAIGSTNGTSNVVLNAATTIAIDSVSRGGNQSGSTGGLSLTAPTSITLNGGAYFTVGGAQTYTGPVIIANATVLTSTNQAISFSSTINGANAFAVTPGTSSVTFNGTIGNTTPPTALSVGSSAAGSIVFNTTTCTTAGPQSFASPVTLNQNATFTSTNNPISFSNTINGNAAGRTVSIAAGTGPVAVSGAIGSTATAMGAITITGNGGTTLSGIGTGAATTGAAAVTSTTGILLNQGTYNASSHSYTGSVTIGANTTITSASTILIAGTLDGDVAGRNLTMTATDSVTLGNVIGDVTPINNLSITGNVINVSDIGSGTTGIAGITTLNSTNAINFNGNTYVAQQQNYTGTSFNLGANSPTSFTAETNSIVFTGGPINLGNNGSLLVTINNGNFSAPEITGNGSQSLFTFVPNGSITIGKIDPLAAVYQTGTSILISNTIEATSVTLIATAGNIANDVGGPFLVTATDFISMNAIGGAVGTLADPIDISTGIAFAGATTNAYFTGVTGDNTVHCLPSNPPTELWFNGVNIGCAAIPVPPTPTPTPGPTPSPIDNQDGQVRKAFFVAGLYSFYYNLSYDVYFVRDLVNMQSIERPQSLFYGKKGI